jgi:DNA-directed RNA polymerase specialized sigma subunit
MEVAAATEQALDWVLDKLSAAKKPAPPQPSLKAPQLEQKQELQAKRPKELEMWKAYRDSGWKPQLLNPLIKSFQPLLNQRINRYKNRVEVPTATIEHEHKVHFVNGLKSYDPGKGVQLNTWVTIALKKAGRRIEANKNFAYISENVSKNIGAYKDFKSELAERLGHEPDDRTVHDVAVKEQHPKLGILSLKDIKRLNQEQRKGLIQTGQETDLLRPTLVDPREFEVAHLIIPQLTPHERLVHEYTLGLNGKPQLKPGAIAKKLKMDNSKVAKLRSAIFKKMKPYLPE